MANVMTIYFSMKGQTIGPFMRIRNQKIGNTAMAAGYISDEIGGESMELIPDKQYPEDHMQLIDEAQDELRAGARVPLKEYPDLQGVDTVFLGYPNWWGHLPMPVVSFLEHYDWIGMRIIPFCSNEGSGLSATVDDIRKYAAHALVEDGLSITGSRTQQSEKKIRRWAKESLNA
ncbi:MAG: flavodoxin [Bilifractor sp.]|jgi:flavodoxin